MTARRICSLSEKYLYSSPTLTPAARAIACIETAFDPFSCMSESTASTICRTRTCARASCTAVMTLVLLGR